MPSKATPTLLDASGGAPPLVGEGVQPKIMLFALEVLYYMLFEPPKIFCLHLAPRFPLSLHGRPKA
jgi:hypothetical protein